MRCVKLKLIYDRGLTQEGVSRPTAFSFPSGAALQRLRSISRDPTARAPRRVPEAKPREAANYYVHTKLSHPTLAYPEHKHYDTTLRHQA